MVPGNDKDKYRKKSYTPQKISQSTRTKELLRNYKKMKKLLDEEKRLRQELEDEPERGWQEIERELNLYSLLVNIGSKGANLEAIAQTLPTPLLIENPATENPNVLRHIHFFDDEKLILSPQWENVLEGHVQRRKEFIKKKQGLMSAARKLFSHLQQLPDDLYYSDNTMSLSACDFNPEIVITQLRVDGLIRTYLKFLAAQSSCTSYQGYDKEVHLKREFKPLSQKSHSPLVNKKIVSLVYELLRIGYAKKPAYEITGKLLHLSYPHIYKDSDPDLVRQRYNYHTKKMNHLKK